MDGTTNKSLYRFAGIGLDTHLKDKLSAVDDESDQIEWWRTLSATASSKKPIEKAMAINTVAMGSLIELRLMNALKKQIIDHE
ncbi:MAG: hypothetical protein QGH37_28030 [Candidatus Poribacteria bacterium]|jgi:hypothetical protein|nr:hypothetical protein [Candidatus Poribacteria bacterium]MDP6996534.1 hypothetical protein [Candidatus Poribacteria bacterium]